MSCVKLAACLVAVASAQTDLVAEASAETDLVAVASTETDLVAMASAQTDSHLGDYSDWDELYSAPGAAGVRGFRFPWHGLTLERLQETLGPQLRSPLGLPDRRVLLLGAGDSSLAEELYDSGVQGLMVVDKSAPLIAMLQEENRELRPGMSFQQEDAVNLRFKDGSFDLAVDLGLLDTLLATNDNSSRLPVQMLQEAYRVLRPGGVFFSVSQEPHRYRLPIVEANPEEAWNCSTAHVNRSRNLDKRVLALNPDLRVDALSVLVCNSTGLATALTSQSDVPLEATESPDVEPAQDLPADPAQASTEAEILEVVFEHPEDWTMEVFLPKMKSMPEPESLVAVDARGVRREMSLTAPPWQTAVGDLAFPISLVITPKRAAAAAAGVGGGAATASAAPTSEEATTGVADEATKAVHKEQRKPPEVQSQQGQAAGPESLAALPESSLDWDALPPAPPRPSLKHPPAGPSDEDPSAGSLPPMEHETEPLAPAEPRAPEAARAAEAAEAAVGEPQESDPEFELPHRDADSMARLKLAMSGMPR